MTPLHSSFSSTAAGRITQPLVWVSTRIASGDLTGPRVADLHLHLPDLTVDAADADDAPGCHRAVARITEASSINAVLAAPQLHAKAIDHMGRNTRRGHHLHHNKRYACENRFDLNQVSIRISYVFLGFLSICWF